MQKLDERLRAEARAGNRAAAMRYLKLRKVKDKHLESTTSQILNLETMVESIVSNVQNQAYIKSLEQGSAALRKMQEV